MKKRILALALSVVMILGVMPFTAFANEPVSYTSALSDSAQYLIKLPEEGASLARAYQWNSNENPVPIVEENGERFLQYNEKNFSKFAKQDAFYVDITAQELTYGLADNVYGIPKDVTFPTTGEGEEAVEDASTLWFAIRIKIKDNGEAFDKTASILRMFMVGYDAESENNDKSYRSAFFSNATEAGRWLDMNDGSMSWFYPDSGYWTGSTNNQKKGVGNLEFTGDMDGYLMVPLSNTDITAEKLRNEFDGFRFLVCEGTSVGSITTKESQWDDKELLIGDSFIVSDPADFQNDIIDAKGIKKYALNGGEDTAYQAIRIGGYRSRYYAVGGGSAYASFFNKDPYDADVANTAETKLGLLHVTTLPNGDRALEITVNTQTNDVVDETTGEPTGETVTTPLTYSGSNYLMGIASFDAYDHMQLGNGDTGGNDAFYKGTFDRAGIPEELKKKFDGEGDDDINYIAFRVAVTGTGTIAVSGTNKAYHLIQLSISTTNYDKTGYATSYSVVNGDYTFVDVNTGETSTVNVSDVGIKLKGDVDGYLIVPITAFGDSLTKERLVDSFGRYPFQERPGSRVYLKKAAAWTSWNDGASFYYGGAVWVENDQTFAAYHTDCEKGGHVYVKTGETAPDCDDAGAITYTCLRTACGHSYDEPVSPLGHTAGDIATPAGDDKNHTFECTVCGQIAKTVKCDYVENVELREEPSYTATGKAYFTCSICGDDKEETLDVLECTHDYGELVPAVEEKHTQEELAPAVAAYYQCSICERYFDENQVETTLEALTGETPVHDYVTPNSDETQHWNECSCGLAGEKLAHEYVTPNSDDTYHWNECACGKAGEKVEHDFATANKDAENHWTECACGAKDAVTPHEFAEVVDEQYLESVATCVSKAVYKKSCACGEVHATETFEAGEFDANNHVGGTYNEGYQPSTCINPGFSGDEKCNSCNAIVTPGTDLPLAQHNPAATWTTDGTYHWKACTQEGCTEPLEKAEHDFATANKDAENHWNECACGEKKDVAPHDFATANKDAENHWNECACGEKKDVAPHDFATANKDAENHWTECACGEKKDVAPHDFATANKDAENHWNECACGATTVKEAHKYDADWDKDCNICSNEREITYAGWAKIDGKWYFYENGNTVKSAWRKDSKGWVYLAADGAMVTNKWVKDSKGWCYVGANGYAVTNEWKKDSKGWIYLDANGSMTKSKWVQTSGKWYYCDANGYMVTSKWQKDSKGWVYVGADGAMVTNKWVKDSKGWCYVGANGYAVTNCWKKDSKGWIYLDENGSMTKSEWVKDGGKWYYCDANGYMVANTTLTIGGKKYTFNASGVWVK